MKKLFLIFLMLIFASSASATVYRWVDERGVLNFADDYSKVPPRFQNNVEEMNIPKVRPSSSSATSGKTVVGGPSGEPSKQPPPVSQTLVREGDFAIKLAESLKMGKPQGEAEAESMLASAGIAPKNGWIADYPLTPDIIGELEEAVGEAADAKQLSMPKNEALKALRTTAVEFELPIVAEVPEGYTESPPPTTPEYTEPNVVDNYYNAEGPPVITYYPPPWDYYYMYAWVPSPFWWSGFYFPGFFILHDFHRVHHGHGHGGHGHHGVVTNHVRDPQTGRISTIDPTRRREGRTSGVREAARTRGFSSTEARNGAQSIFKRSRERSSSNMTSTPMTDRGRDIRNPAVPRSRIGNEKQVYSRQSNASGINNRNSNNGRSPLNNQRLGQTPLTGRTFSRPESMNRQNGAYAQRPFTSQAPSFHQPSQGGGRSFSMAPQGGGQHFNSSPNSRGFSGSHQGGGIGGFGQGGGQHYGSSSGGSGFSGSHQGGGSGGSFGGGGGFRH